MKKSEPKNVFKERSDDSLVSSSGMSAPYAELLRRNTEALEKATRSEEKYSIRILFLTVVLLAMLQQNSFYH